MLRVYKLKLSLLLCIMYTNSYKLKLSVCTSSLHKQNQSCEHPMAHLITNKRARVKNYWQQCLINPIRSDAPGFPKVGVSSNNYIVYEKSTKQDQWISLSLIISFLFCHLPQSKFQSP